MGRRKKKEDPPAGLPAWMATFSDLVTLLLTFFVLLTAMANFEDITRVDAVFRSIREALGAGSQHRKLLDTDQTAMANNVRDQMSLKPIVSRLKQAMSRHVSDNLVRVTKKPNEIRIRLDEQVFFAPGSRTLHPAAYALIGDVAEVLRPEDVDIRVEGYADGTGKEEKNWKLSGDRALAVVMALRSRGPIPGERLESVAMGSFRPGALIGEDNDWDRRIEIVVKADHAGGQAAIESLFGGADGRE